MAVSSRLQEKNKSSTQHHYPSLFFFCLFGYIKYTQVKLISENCRQILTLTIFTLNTGLLTGVGPTKRKCLIKAQENAVHPTPQQREQQHIQCSEIYERSDVVEEQVCQRLSPFREFVPVST